MNFYKFVIEKCFYFFKKMFKKAVLISSLFISSCLACDYGITNLDNTKYWDANPISKMSYELMKLDGYYGTSSEGIRTIECYIEYEYDCDKFKTRDVVLVDKSHNTKQVVDNSKLSQQTITSKNIQFLILSMSFRKNMITTLVNRPNEFGQYLIFYCYNGIFKDNHIQLLKQFLSDDLKIKVDCDSIPDCRYLALMKKNK